MEQPVQQRKKRFLDRPVRLMWPVYLVIAVIIIGIAAYGVHSWQIARLERQARSAIKDAVLQKAESLGQTIAIVSRDDILKSNSDKLQSYFDDLVRMPETELQYIAVMKLNGVAMVHTNSKFAGKRLDDKLAQEALKATEIKVTDVPSEKIYDVAVPVMGFTSKAAVVRLGVSYAKAEQFPTRN